jgi:DmsE family decaheme c-type cytochrome
LEEVRFLRICVLGYFGLGLGWAQEPSTSPFVGSAVCRTCHPDVWSTFYKNPHYKTLALARQPRQHEPLGAAGCETCHGPGQKHVEARGGKDTIIAFSRLTPKAVSDKCLTCHGETMRRANIQRSTHSLADVACNSCHSIHRSPVARSLLVKKQAELCYGCHAQVRAQFSMPFKHRVNEGVMTCSDCHNPHGVYAPTWRMAVRPRMVDQALGNEQPCVKCHADKQGPFVFEHAAVRVDGCEACHLPHGSANPRLMRRPVVATLCLECHNGAGNFGRNAQGIPLQTPSHNMADPRYHNCTSCHVRIHGSNGDARFLR